MRIMSISANDQILSSIEDPGFTCCKPRPALSLVSDTGLQKLISWCHTSQSQSQTPMISRGMMPCGGLLEQCSYMPKVSLDFDLGPLIDNYFLSLMSLCLLHELSYAFKFPLQEVETALPVKWCYVLDDPHAPTYFF